MTNFRIERLPFDGDALSTWSKTDERHNNWPVVYTISADDEIYVGETLNVANRLSQHLISRTRPDRSKVTIVFNDNVNKSVCLDRESQCVSVAIVSVEGYERLFLIFSYEESVPLKGTQCQKQHQR